MKRFLKNNLIKLMVFAILLSFVLVLIYLHNTSQLKESTLAPLVAITLCILAPIHPILVGYRYSEFGNKRKFKKLYSTRFELYYNKDSKYYNIFDKQTGKFFQYIGGDSRTYSSYYQIITIIENYLRDISNVHENYKKIEI